MLRRSRFLTGEHDKQQLDIRDVVWVNANGGEMTDVDWESNWLRCFGVVLDGPRPQDGNRAPRRGRTAC